MADQEQEPQVDYRLEVLRAAGHEAAAELLGKLPQPVAEPQPEPEPAPEQAPPPRTLTPAEAVEAQRQAEGQAMLDAMRRQIGRQWATVQEGPASDDR